MVRSAKVVSSVPSVFNLAKRLYPLSSPLYLVNEPPITIFPSDCNATACIVLFKFNFAKVVSSLPSVLILII